MIEFSASEVSAYYHARVQKLKPNARGWVAPCPVHGGKNPNFSVQSSTGMAFCHSKCQVGWDMISLEQALSACDFVKAKRQVFTLVGRAEPSWEERDVEAIYDYQDARGELQYQVVRKAGKKFMQRRPDGKGGWTWGLGNVAPLPYRLPQWRSGEFVCIAEGEGDVRALERAGFPATCNNGGAGNFKPELAPYFAGKRVAIFHDNDDPGRGHALKVAALLSGTAASVKIIELPGLKPKGDVRDFLNDGGTAEQIQKRIDAAQEWTPQWEFSSEIPDENDKFVRTLVQEIEAEGGPDRFWDFTLQPGVPTPWAKLTKALGGGMRDGEVYVIAGNQGSGKTSLALQFAIHAGRHRHGILMFSMEMGWRDVFQRMVATEAQVDLLEFQEAQRAGRDTALYRHALSESTAMLAEISLFVSTRTGVTPEYIVAETIRLKKRQPIHLVLVDHMQLMATTGNVRGDYEKFTAISRAMKTTARDAEVPVLLVSQTSRANSTDRRAELEVSDLRGSGAIEEDAAAVMLLYPDKEDSARAMSSNTFTSGPVRNWLKIGKNRYGVSGAYVGLMHMKKFTRFDEEHRV